ncbi:hypothetical protein C7M84_006285 [Penaeus vannamei]|uniref:Uncharacterized protein n=1 Tax=Penaeus vannamei TaxID=6689 RepID=A0A3R7M8X6_PENVA|nr:hypothetical protein C7M84_006285 [Penaeus vannamei]
MGAVVSGGHGGGGGGGYGGGGVVGGHGGGGGGGYGGGGVGEAMGEEVVVVTEVGALEEAMEAEAEAATEEEDSAEAAATPHLTPASEATSEEAEGFVGGAEEMQASPSEDAYFRLVRASDATRCGQRLVCELASRAGLGLEHDEQMILEVLKEKPAPSRRKDEARALYETAMKTGYSGAHCSATYKTCPYSSQQIMAVIRTIGEDVFNTRVLREKKHNIFFSLVSSEDEGGE